MMDLIQNQYLDNTILICNKDESHSKYLELLFENRKRTGGDEMFKFYWDKSLNQYIIIYKDKKTVDEVLTHGSISYNNQQFLPFRVDKTKFIIENIDQNLEKDILHLYVENLLQDTGNCNSKIEQLFNDFFLVTCDKQIDFDKLKERFNRHNKIQNRDIIMHLVAKLRQFEFKNSYYSTLNQASRNSPNSSDDSNEQVSELNDEGFIEICTKKPNNVVLIQDDVSLDRSINNNSPIEARTPIRIKILEDRIKYLEEKLKMYENLKSALVKINTLSQECVNSLNKPQLNPTRITPFMRNMFNSPPTANRTTSTIRNSTERETQKEQYVRPRLRTFVRDNELNRLETVPNTLPNPFHRRRSPIISTFEPIRISEFFPMNTSSNRPTGRQRHGLYFRDESPINSDDSPRTRTRVSDVLSDVSIESSPSRETSPNDILFRINNFDSNTGLSITMINRFPIIKYKQPKSAFKSVPNDKDKDESSTQNMCLICLEQLVENDELRLLSCFHQFHVNCIDKWLKEKSICPCCKSCLRKSLITPY